MPKGGDITPSQRSRGQKEGVPVQKMAVMNPMNIATRLIEGNAQEFELDGEVEERQLELPRDI